MLQEGAPCPGRSCSLVTNSAPAPSQVGTQGFSNSLAETTATVIWGKARSLQMLLKGCEKSQDGDKLITASANLGAKMRAPKATPARATVAVQSGQNKHLSEFMKLWLLGIYGKQHLALSPDCKGLKNTAGINFQQQQQARDEECIIPSEMCLGPGLLSPCAMGLFKN